MTKHHGNLGTKVFVHSLLAGMGTEVGQVSYKHIWPSSSKRYLYEEDKQLDEMLAQKLGKKKLPYAPQTQELIQR
jgi:hypothetical protein